jgi:hypothetical protein
MGTDINFKNHLGRTYGTRIGLPAFDPAAQAFISAAGITDPTQQNAIDALVVGLKTDGLWTKMKAIYPFVGGTATTHKFNLKDPRDLDAAFRLVFNGGWTHSSTGATPNGTNGYADTKLNENTTMTLNNIHMSVYSRTNNTISSCDIGCLDSSTLYGTHIIPYSGGNAAIRNTDLSTGFTATESTAGLFINSRISSAQSKYFYNASLFNTVVSPSISKSNQVYFLSARNTAGIATLFSNKQAAFASIGDGLLDSEASALYNHVQNFQLALNRAV